MIGIRFSLLQTTLNRDNHDAANDGKPRPEYLEEGDLEVIRVSDQAAADRAVFRYSVL